MLVGLETTRPWEGLFHFGRQGGQVIFFQNPNFDTLHRRAGNFSSFHCEKPLNLTDFG